MAKRCDLEDLKPGMILDRTIFDDKGAVLLETGTVLTEMLISMLQQRFYGSYLAAFIRESHEELAEAVAKASSLPVPEEDVVLDTGYMSLYDTVIREMRQLLADARERKALNLEQIGSFVAEGHLDEICDGARAVTQLHNMQRDDDYLLHHSVHVAILAGLMGRWLHWPAEDRERLLLTGLLHDIGKVKIPENVLQKTKPLSSSDYNLIRRHPREGYELLCQSGLENETAITYGVLQHHERMDGSGYPNGFKGDSICDFARIIAILDMYDAIASNRSYDRRQSPFDAFDILLADMMSGKLDAKYGVLFVKKVCQSLIGSWVRLASGKKAKIVYIDQSRTSALPIVETEDGEFWDITTKKDDSIVEMLTYDEVIQ
ncbi:MAG: HD-GYP domain-containing protein [Schwartzia sp.]|nr:HD-GYP domain-containing protein [Schwartzia sp. (in: firmicutes)]